MGVDVGQIKWCVSSAANSQLASVRSAFGPDYGASKSALQKCLCDYFNQGACSSASGKTISPVECHVADGKGLKVRWMVPGCGKSGGLRLAVLVYCNQKKVVIAGAWMRKDDPDDSDFKDAFNAATA